MLNVCDGKFQDIVLYLIVKKNYITERTYITGEKQRKMTKYDYLSRLKHYLQPLPAKERNAALKYYDKYFTDAGPENEYNIIMNLGNPKELAEKILNNKHTISGMLNQTKSNVKKAKGKMTESQRRTFLLMTILLFPVWGGFLLIIALAAAAFFTAAAGILLLMAITGIVLFCMSIPYISNNTSVGLFFMGTGLAMASAAVLLFVPVMNFVFYIFKLTVKSLILLFNKLIGRKAVKA